jgi:hypothetical protein
MVVFQSMLSIYCCIYLYSEFGLYGVFRRVCTCKEKDFIFSGLFVELVASSQHLCKACLHLLSFVSNVVLYKFKVSSDCL